MTKNGSLHFYFTSLSFHSQLTPFVSRDRERGYICKIYAPEIIEKSPISIVFVVFLPYKWLNIEPPPPQFCTHKSHLRTQSTATHIQPQPALPPIHSTTLLKRDFFVEGAGGWGWGLNRTPRNTFRDLKYAIRQICPTHPHNTWYLYRGSP